MHNVRFYELYLHTYIYIFFYRINQNEQCLLKKSNTAKKLVYIIIGIKKVFTHGSKSKLESKRESLPTKNTQFNVSAGGR